MSAAGSCCRQEAEGKRMARVFGAGEEAATGYGARMQWHVKTGDGWRWSAEMRGGGGGDGAMLRRRDVSPTHATRGRWQKIGRGEVITTRQTTSPLAPNCKSFRVHSQTPLLSVTVAGWYLLHFEFPEISTIGERITPIHQIPLIGWRSRSPSTSPKAATRIIKHHHTPLRCLPLTSNIFSFFSAFLFL